MPIAERSRGGARVRDASLGANGQQHDRIGAVVDQTGGSTSPHYRAAIELAGRQMNDALAQAGSNVRFDLVFGDSKSNPPFAQQEALRLINQHGVKALVGDSSGVIVALNRLNYDPASQAKGKVAITCFQCSSSFINDPDGDAIRTRRYRRPSAMPTVGCSACSTSPSSKPGRWRRSR